MEAVITFNELAHVKLQALGLQIPSMWGEVSLDSLSTFEPPLYLQAFSPHTLVQVGAFCSVSSMSVGMVTMGRYCSIGPEVVLGANEHPSDWISTSRITHVRNMNGWAKFLSRDAPEILDRELLGFAGACPQTNIGNDVWIGRGAFIKAGITIGDGAIIGARAVVTKDVLPFSIVAGVPATVKRMRFPDKVVERIVRLCWWNYSLLGFAEVPFSKIDWALDTMEYQISHEGIQVYSPPVLSVAEIIQTLS